MELDNDNKYHDLQKQLRIGTRIARLQIQIKHPIANDRKAWPAKSRY